MQIISIILKISFFQIKFIPDDIVHKSVLQALNQNFLVIAMVKLVEGDGDKHWQTILN